MNIDKYLYIKKKKNLNLPRKFYLLLCDVSKLMNRYLKFTFTTIMLKNV